MKNLLLASTLFNTVVLGAHARIQNNDGSYTDGAGTSSSINLKNLSNSSISPITELWVAISIHKVPICN